MKNIIIFILIIGFSLAIHGWLNGNVADADSFYHIRHSWIYRTTGLFQTDFPWTQYSTINQYSSDIWYGFHILILPFTYFKNLVDGITTGAVFITIATLSLFWLALKRLRVRWPIVWLAIFTFASPDFLYRLIMLRPHAISLGLALVIFAYLTTTTAKKDKIILFILSAAFSWIHLSLSWLPILIFLIVAAIRLIKKEWLVWKDGLAVALGLLAGLILRPNFIGAAKLAYIQVFQLLLEKGASLPLRFGRELSPFVWENFVDQLIPITLLIVSAGVIVLWLKIKGRRPGAAVSASLILCVIFYILSFVLARRSNDVFVGFAALFLGIFTTDYWFSIPKEKLKRWQSQLSLVGILLIAVLSAMFIKTLYRLDGYVVNSFNPSGLKEVSAWLEKNTKPQEIVFNIHWDRFAQLFFWNYSNYYINGMDPIFEYSYDSSLYWKTHFFATDSATTFTCGKIRCTEEEVEKTNQVLKQDFKASYLVIEKMRSPKFYKYLESAPEFNKAFETPTEAIFKIL